MTEAYISSINMNQYGPKGKPAGSIGIAGSLATHFSLTEEEAEELAAIARKIFTKRQQAFVNEVADLRVDAPLLGVTKTIDADGDDIPF